MIFARSFVFFHIPKTGGRWFEKQLNDHAPAEWGIDYQEGHWTAEDLASHRPELVERTRLLFVRNPWEAYVSLFENWRDKGEFAELTTSFSEFVKHLVSTNHTMSTWVKNVLTDGVPSVIGKFEHLREDARVLLSAVEDIPPQLRIALDTAPPVNTSRHEHYSAYYTPKLRDMVEVTDRAFVTKYGYSFEERAP